MKKGFRRLYALGISILMGSLLSACKQPNVVVLMLDDLDVSSFNTLVETGHLPHITTNIIKPGVTFDNSFVTNSICCPSRATFLTGQYTKNHGVLTVAGGIHFWDPTKRKPGVVGEENTLATWMKDAGYRTAHIGKYLNGYGYSTALDYVPPGYDYWFGLLDPFTYRVHGWKANENRKIVSGRQEPLDYQTDFLADKAATVVRSHDASKPLFMVLTPITPHIEFLLENMINGQKDGYNSHFSESIRPAPRHKYLADGDLSNGEMPDPPSLKKVSFNSDGPDGFKDKPPFFENIKGMDEKAISAMRMQWRNRLAAMKSVDDMVGRLVSELKSKNMLSDTLFVLTSDNGYFFGEHGLSSKILAYEEAIRVPLVISGPSVAGSRRENKIALNIDLAATLADAGLASPKRTIDGRSLMPILRDPKMNWERRRFLVEHYEENDKTYIHFSQSYLQDMMKNFSQNALTGLTKLLSGIKVSSDFDFNRMSGPDKTETTPTDFKAIRALNDQRNTLYVQWYDSRESKLNNPIFKEFYNINSDPCQISSRVPNDTSALQKQISDFMICKGQNCRDLEK